MTTEEAESLQPRDTVTRNGETGTVQSFISANELKVSVEWEGGRTGVVRYSELERA